MMADLFKVEQHPDLIYRWEVRHADGSLAVGLAFHDKRDADALAEKLNNGEYAAEYEPGEI